MKSNEVFWQGFIDPHEYDIEYDPDTNEFIVVKHKTIRGRQVGSPIAITRPLTEYVRGDYEQMVYEALAEEFFDE